MGSIPFTRGPERTPTYHEDFVTIFDSLANRIPGACVSQVHKSNRIDVTPAATVALRLLFPQTLPPLNNILHILPHPQRSIGARRSAFADRILDFIATNGCGGDTATNPATARVLPPLWLRFIFQDAGIWFKDRSFYGIDGSIINELNRAATRALFLRTWPWSTDVVSPPTKPPSSTATGIFRHNLNLIVPTTTCPASLSERKDCGFFGIDQPQCEAKRCCWSPVSPNPKNAPWCFFKTVEPAVAAAPALAKR
ncbi:hypothetical protein BDK51DRAFT_43844 [Blyttiomyces helicus]|uniref:P-type domain-containing protein n=1 Tax=Blyttiomyces helicus TaxID=388810 RepID=A0A4V1IQE8_9FUNG|nr:hypothetical protein BDK51DRAFT_43844 [Blyttiomyces helicus]|eukprot:RKO86307.1 hypothetical protein BDK51DRAFT_43844 [Blyttiomyces helicus]